MYLSYKNKGDIASNKQSSWWFIKSNYCKLMRAAFSPSAGWLLTSSLLCNSRSSSTYVITYHRRKPNYIFLKYDTVSSLVKTSPRIKVTMYFKMKQANYVLFRFTLQFRYQWTCTRGLMVYSSLMWVYSDNIFRQLAT